MTRPNTQSHVYERVCCRTGSQLRCYDLAGRSSLPLAACQAGLPTNKDGSQGVVYLVTSDTTLTWEQITTLYQKRWKVEEYHKSLKSNLGFAKSPTKTIRTQTNHLFACLVAFVKMEKLRLQTKCNHFAMKAKLYEAAIAAAYEQLQQLKTKCSLA